MALGDGALRMRALLSFGLHSEFALQAPDKSNSDGIIIEQRFILLAPMES
jgi:hypothetical protein